MSIRLNFIDLYVGKDSYFTTHNLTDILFLLIKDILNG